MNAKTESRLPGFRTYAEFFREVNGKYTVVRSGRTERRKLVRRLTKLRGEPRDLVEGAREDLLATARVREIRNHADGRQYVRYEVRPLMDDCSWDAPQQMLTLWSEGEVLVAYTFICGTGRDVRVAGNLHVEHGGEEMNEIVYDLLAAERFLSDMEPGDSLLVGNDGCNCEFMTVSNVNGSPLVSWQVFADAWWMNATDEVSWAEALSAVRQFWSGGVIKLQEMFTWEPADPWDENTGMRTIHVARGLRRALMRAVRTRDRILEETIRHFGITEAGGVKTLDVAVEHGDWKDMMLALDREWSRLYKIWPAVDRERLCLYLAIEDVGGADRDIATYFDEEVDGKKNDAFDFAKMVYWNEKGARTGDVQSQKNAGYLFRGADGIKHNGQRAVYWFEKAAEQKDPEAMRALAKCLECGRCVRKDDARAEQLRTMAKEIKSGVLAKEGEDEEC